jgi:peptidoglycan/LPS O-acetylase OafA/YrhL
MTFSRWIGLAGGVLIAAIAVATLIPEQWQLRTGLHWLTEHFLIYFAATAIICLAWLRPFVVAGALMVLAGLLEALQGLTADRIPDFPTAFSGAAGVAAAALLADLVISLRKGRAAAKQGDKPAKRALARPEEI